MKVGRSQSVQGSRSTAVSEYALLTGHNSLPSLLNLQKQGVSYPKPSVSKDLQCFSKVGKILIGIIHGYPLWGEAEQFSYYKAKWVLVILFITD